MTTAFADTTFAPASQVTFAPRPVTAAPPALIERGGLALVPDLAVSPTAAHAVDPGPLATVHHLPVRRSADIYRRRRLVALSLLVGLALGIVSFVSQADATPTPQGELAQSVTVVVQPGDTLWGIASTLAPDADPRALVAELEEITGSTALQPGQEIIVPGRLLQD